VAATLAGSIAETVNDSGVAGLTTPFPIGRGRTLTAQALINDDILGDVEAVMAPIRGAARGLVDAALQAVFNSSSSSFYTSDSTSGAISVQETAVTNL
jgi:hypothetical protein